MIWRKKKIWAFKGFWPLETRWDDSSNLFVKDAHSSYDVLFSLTPLKIKGIPKWFCHQSITNQKKIKKKSKYKTIFSKNGLRHPLYTKIHPILSKCDNVIVNIKIYMLWPQKKLCENFHKYEK